MSHSRDTIHVLTKTTHTKLAGGLPTALSASGNLKVSIEESSAGGDATLAEQQTQTAHLSVIEGDTTSIDGKVVACNTGAVVVSTSALPTGASTSALQTTGNSSLSSIDGKITACNTGAVVVSSSALPSGAATESTLATLDGKVTACNTGAVVVSSSALPSGAATESTLASLDGKVTACNTGAVVVSSSALPSGAATETTLAAPQYQEGDAIGASDKGVLVMGRNGTNTAKPIHITSNGDVEVEIADFVKGQAASSASFPVVLANDQSEITAHPLTVNNLGSQANIINNASLANGATSSSVDVSNFNTAMVMVEDASTSSFDGYDLEVSEDNSNFYAMTSLYPSVRGGKREGVLYDLRLNGVKYVRLFNNSSTDTYTTVYATIVGSPN
jgi:sorbitol-specific phosphotransferase system component IIA